MAIHSLNARPGPTYPTAGKVASMFRSTKPAREIDRKSRKLVSRKLARPGPRPSLKNRIVRWAGLSTLSSRVVTQIVALHVRRIRSIRRSSTWSRKICPRALWHWKPHSQISGWQSELEQTSWTPRAVGIRFRTSGPRGARCPPTKKCTIRRQLPCRGLAPARRRGLCVRGLALSCPCWDCSRMVTQLVTQLVTKVVTQAQPRWTAALGRNP